MKVTNELLMTNGDTALEIASIDKRQGIDRIGFDEWAEKCQITAYAKIDYVYKNKHFGDSHYPAIIIDKDAPDAVKTLCLLRWK